MSSMTAASRVPCAATAARRRAAAARGAAPGGAGGSAAGAIALGAGRGYAREANGVVRSTRGAFGAPRLPRSRPKPRDLTARGVGEAAVRLGQLPAGLCIALRPPPAAAAAAAALMPAV
jgi:hypothetical protein